MNVKAKKPDRNGLRCRVCGCTETDACAGGCRWVEDDLCSVCATAAEAVADWMWDARRSNKAALWREALRIWSDTPVPYKPTTKEAA